VLVSDEPATAAAFEREAGLLARLRHPGLPHVSDLLRHGDRLCMVMQLIPGDSLARIPSGGVALGDLLRHAMSLVDVIGYLHRQQPAIVHGDVKPHNLLVTPDGALVLLDLGVASESGQRPSLPTPLAFSAAYAAPEQLRGEPRSPATDLFAIGATLYHLATGHAPLEAQLRLQTFAERHADPRRPPDELEPAVPAALSAVVMQLLALDARLRPGAGQLRDRLAVLAGAPTMPARAAASPASALPTPRHPPGRTRRRPLGARRRRDWHPAVRQHGGPHRARLATLDELRDPLDGPAGRRLAVLRRPASMRSALRTSSSSGATPPAGCNR
jgi:serine/threonine protein kinase